MKHDPICIDWLGSDESNIDHCDICDVIARAREEAYAAGYEEARKYYTNSCFSCGYAGEWSTYVCDECEERMNKENEEWNE